ncbi:uncharacterized protein LOC129575377 [Sitodiplosis mosellana]|uniref:uncharacterized protein LOC129575377 n=1 Tax=Sitodiplosis mosellana TaxID=263140 RepID=UPI002444F2DA|nr:uncharacterized protein LOC129575377 [Sitodiplosis mosellana]
MIGSLSIFALLASISSIRAAYNGPFILWGRDELSQAKINPMSQLNEKVLRDIYADSSAIILFVRNASSHLKEDNFPIFKDLLSKTSYVYLAQEYLGLDPMEFNLNAEVINLVGPTSQQDVELSALYRDSVITYGEGKVLGILATRSNDHEIRKRDAVEPTPDSPSTTLTPTTQEIEQSNQTDFIYYPDDKKTYKILLYTSAAPILFDGTNETILNHNVQTYITTDHRSANENKEEQRTLVVRYNYKDKLTIEYVFNISVGYWTLIGADIDWLKITSNNTLNLVDDRPSAPLTFSYQCSRPLFFRNGNIYLKLANIQVQVEVNARRFNDSYYCIGFTSAPIWSGVVISFILCFAVALGLNCIMEIKAPSRFENSRGKQLTFTVQE